MTEVLLREFRDADTDDLVAGCTDPLVRRFLPLPHPYTAREAADWITAGGPAAFARGGAAFAVADPGTGRLLGGVGLDRLVPERQQGEIGYWTAPWARGRGVATAGVRTLAQWAFDRGLGRLEVLADWANVASQRVAGAAGFQPEGERRGGGDGRRDLLVYARLAGDPPGPLARPLPDLPGGELTDEVVRLRPLTGADVEHAARLHAVPDVAAISVPPGVPERAATERRCVRAPARWLAGARAELVVEDAATGTPAGEIQLTWAAPGGDEAAIGYTLLPAWRGRGFATRAVRLLALWAFAETGSGRLVATALPGNVASRRVLERAGFRPEGRLRSALRAADGSRVDGVRHALVAEDLLRTVRDDVG